jgi:hypothetical protein
MMNIAGQFPIRFSSVVTRICAVCFILTQTPLASADLLSQFFAHDIDVLTVTDVTKAGQAYPLPTATEPVYYMIIDVGETNFGRSWAGEDVPTSKVARRWMMEAMREQHYLLADKLHPPTQLFVFGWGMISGGSDRPALGFLGGDKVDLMWEQQHYGGFVDSKVLLRGIQRVGITGKVWDIAESNLFMGIVRSFTMDSLKTEKPVTKLWETRFGCPATGLSLKNAMPLMIKAAAVNLGRETKKPVNLDASDFFKGHVDLGELKFLGQVPPGEKNGKPAPPPETH